MRRAADSTAWRRHQIGIGLISALLLGCSAEATEQTSIDHANVELVRGAPIDSTPTATLTPTPTPTPAPAPTPTPAAPPGHLAAVHAQAESLDDEKKTGQLEVVGDTTHVTFADLAFARGDTITKGDKEIPAQIRALDGKKVAIDGFMIPMDFEEDEVRSFLLTRFPPGCCFGMLPAMDQWIDVEMVSEIGADIVEMRIVRTTGELEVGELLDDYGYLSSVYRLDATAVVSQW